MGGKAISIKANKEHELWMRENLNLCFTLKYGYHSFIVKVVTAHYIKAKAEAKEGDIGWKALVSHRKE